MKTIAYIALVFLLIGCTSSNRSDETISKKESPRSEVKDLEKDQNEPQIRHVVYYNYSNVTFDSAYSDSATHFFSNNEVADKFEIRVPSGNINHTQSTLLIISQSGDTIHFERFETWSLIYGYTLDQIHSDGEVIEHIKDRVRENIAPSSFIDISRTDLRLFQDAEAEEFEDYETFVSCRNHNLPLFHFVLWNESGTFYGYSKANKRAVPILYCC